jgi:hypothetical protein
MPGFSFNPSGSTAIAVILETNRRPANMLAALTNAWPDLGR